MDYGKDHEINVGIIKHLFFNTGAIFLSYLMLMYLTVNLGNESSFYLIFFIIEIEIQF